MTDSPNHPSTTNPPTHFWRHRSRCNDHDLPLSRFLYDILFEGHLKSIAGCQRCSSQGFMPLSRTSFQCLAAVSFTLVVQRTSSYLAVESPDLYIVTPLICTIASFLLVFLLHLCHNLPISLSLSLSLSLYVCFSGLSPLLELLSLFLHTPTPKKHIHTTGLDLAKLNDLHSKIQQNTLQKIIVPDHTLKPCSGRPALCKRDAIVTGPSTRYAQRHITRTHHIS